MNELKMNNGVLVLDTDKAEHIVTAIYNALNRLDDDMRDGAYVAMGMVLHSFGMGKFASND